MVQITKKALTYGMDKEYVNRFFISNAFFNVEEAYCYEHKGNKFLVEVTRKWKVITRYPTMVVIEGRFKTIEFNPRTLREAKELIKSYNGKGN